MNLNINISNPMTNGYALGSGTISLFLVQVEPCHCQCKYFVLYNTKVISAK